MTCDTGGPDAFLRAYLGDLLDAAVTRRHVGICKLTQLHVLDVMVDFARADAVPRDPLAVQLISSQSLERRERLRALRRLGDQSLFLCGFFEDWICAGVMPMSYYIDMGMSAYAQAARIAPITGTIYDELSRRFVRVVDVLGAVAEATTLGRRQLGPGCQLS